MSSSSSVSLPTDVNSPSSSSGTHVLEPQVFHFLPFASTYLLSVNRIVSCLHLSPRSSSSSLSSTSTTPLSSTVPRGTTYAECTSTTPLSSNTLLFAGTTCLNTTGHLSRPSSVHGNTRRFFFFGAPGGPFSPPSRLSKMESSPSASDPSAC